MNGDAPSFSAVIVGETTLPVRCAEILLEEGHDVRAIVSEDDAVRAWAAGADVLCLEPGTDLIAPLREAAVDWLLSINNLWVIPDELLRLARRGGVNFHDGPLPRFAGLNAPTWGLLEGAVDWEVTWHAMTGGIDEGDVLVVEPVHIEPDDTSLTLNSRCYEAAIESFRRLADGLARGTLHPRSQDPAVRRYFARDRRPDAVGVLRSARPADELARLVRALDFGSYANPLCLPKVLLGDDALLVSHATVRSTRTGELPGTIVAAAEDTLTVAADDGEVVLQGLRTQDGRPAEVVTLLTQAELGPGNALPSLTEAEAEAITRFHESVSRHEAYWQRRLREATPLRLPTIEAPTADGPAEGRRNAIQILESAVVDSLGATNRRARPDDLVVGALAAFLARTSGNAAFEIGYREQLGPEPPGRRGALFARQLPLAVTAPPDATGRDCLDRLVDELAAVRARGTYARDLVARMDGQVLGSDDYPIAVWQEGDALSDGTSALTVVVSDGGRRLEWVADARVDADGVSALQQQLLVFLDELAREPGACMWDLPVVPEAERVRLLVDWNATEADYQRDACIHELVAEQAVRNAGRVAVWCRDVSLTYTELEERADRLAHELRRRGVRPGTRVGVCAERSVELVVGLLAVLKAGGAYVPLDPSYPPERIALMVEDADPVAILAHRAVRERLLRNAEGVVLLDDEPLASDGDESPLPHAARPEDPAYVIYTSGSTGRPKGVTVTHRNVVNFFAGMDGHVQHDPPGVFLAVTSISFDISVLELFWTLARGFTVILHAGDPLTSASRSPAGGRLDFSLFFFASDDAERAEDRYRLLLEAARFADERGFAAVWTPERHFHAFGGLFPNPSVTSAVLAAITERVALRAGSVVSPLHDPVRIAEEWAFVDNISGGRVGISFAPGWQPQDFVLAPDRFERRKEVMLEGIEGVHHLWRGGALARRGPGGEEHEVRILPRPVQPDLPTWLTAAGNPETFRLAGSRGWGVLTHLLGQSVEELADKIAVYRGARADAGLDAGGGHIVLMLHTFVGPDEDDVREAVREPMKAYLRSSVGLIKRAAWTFPTFRLQTTTSDGSFSLDHLTDEQLDAVLDFSFERYFETSGLLGTPDKCAALAQELRAVGVDEIACLIDFHGDADAVLEHLPNLDDVRRHVAAAADESDLSIPTLIDRFAVTHMQCTPSLATMLVQTEDGRHALSGLQQLLVGGEAFPPELAATLAELVPGEVLNMYGPTETTIWSSVQRLDDVGTTVPIGRPIANTRMYVLDEERRPLPAGAPGELYIGGDGVASGYLGRPELTAERFVPDPFRPGETVYRTGDLVRHRPDGSLEFLGRLDHQVKVRGYRVELGEIEAELADHADVTEAVVVAVDGADGSRALAAYVAGRRDELSSERLRSHVRRRLPEFMVPSTFDVLESLPRTPNGKVDRAALPVPGATPRRRETSRADPRGGLEQALVEIWERELGVRPIGTTDSFFELGGHSLLAVRIFAQIESRFGVRMPLAALFRSPTVADLAAAIREQAPDLTVEAPPRRLTTAASEGESWSPLVPIQPHGTRTPLFLVHAHGGHVLFYKDLARRLDADQPFYALQAHGVDGSTEPLETFEEMAAAYVDEVRAVQPHGPYRLGGDCLGGVLAYEMAQQLRDSGEEVEIVAMFDSFHPAYRPHVPPRLYGAVHFTRLILVHHLPTIARLPWNEKWPYLKTKGVKAVRQVIDHLPVGRHGASDPDPLARTQETLARAFDHYRPRPYDGPVTLFRAERQPWGIRHDPLLGWSGVASGLECVEVPTYFQCGVLEPAVGTLVAELECRLDEAERARRRGDSVAADREHAVDQPRTTTRAAGR